MRLNDMQTLWMVVAVVAATMLTRFLPFVLFPEGKKLPPFVDRLSELLPPAMMGLLVVYCLRNVNILSGSYGLPEGIAVAVTAALHLWRRNTLVSIGIGTVVYMLLVQQVFV